MLEKFRDVRLIGLRNRSIYRYTIGVNQEPLKEPDERDMIEPLKETPDGADAQHLENESDTPEDRVAGEQEITLGGIDEQVGSADDDPDGGDAQHLENESDTPEDRVAGEQKVAVDGVYEQVGRADDDNETEIDPDETDAGINGQLDPDDTTEAISDETAVSLGAAAGEPEGEDGGVSDDITTDDEPNVDDESSEQEKPSAKDPQKDPAENSNLDDSVALDDDIVDDGIDEKLDEEEAFAGGHDKKEDVRTDQAEKNAAEEPEPVEVNEIDKKEKAPLKSSAKSQKRKNFIKAAASSRKMIVSALIIVMISGYIIYSKPALLGLKGQAEKEFSVKTETTQPAVSEQVQVPKSKPSGKHDFFLAKLEEVDRLRENLLAKKEEIYRLKLHYQNGIVELKDKIGREMREANISSYARALMNKRMKLDLRTIQRRQAYIQGLEKPDQWIHKGSEELLFLKRKGLLDLQMSDIASGIDLDRHMRYMNAAIQTYQPSAEKLALDPPPAELTSLEAIWSQIINQQVENVQSPIGPNDEQIMAEICSGDFRRIAELSAITANAARCLSRMKGSDIFLNGLTQINAEEAKYLFQWRGSWICLNNVKKLSPAVARYLFKWEGNWISLNGLTEFPPELAVYLMEWKGNQLELMGLNYDKSKLDQRALKYLALWETMGGKLFISDGIRKEMARVM